MKKFVSRFLPVLLLSVGTWAFYSCSDDDQTPVPAPKPTKAQLFSRTYSGKPYMDNVLKLRYNSADLFGKEAELKVDDSCKWAVLTMRNVFPGEPVVVVDSLKLTPSDVDTTGLNIDIRSNFETPSGIRLMVANGKVKEGELSFDLFSIQYPKNELTEISNWWAPSPLNPEDYSGCLYMLWHTPPGTYLLPNANGPADTLVVTEEDQYNPAGLMDFIPMLANQLLPMFLRDVNFDGTGVLRAHYASDALTGGPTWQYSPAENLCHYYVSDGKLRLILNIQEIMRQVGSDQTKADVGITPDQIYVLLGILNQAITEGLPMQIVHQNDEAGTVTVSLNFAQLKPLLEMLPLLKGLLPTDGMASLLTGMLDMIYNLVMISDNIEIGLNLVPIERPADI